MSNIKKEGAKQLINKLKKELTEKARHQKEIKKQLRLSADELIAFHPDAGRMLHEDLAEITKDMQGLKSQLAKANKALGKPKVKMPPATMTVPVMKKRRMGGIVTRGYGKALRGY